MEKSYTKLLKKTRRAREENAAAVAVTVGSLRRHSCRNVICSRCENDDVSRFKVTDIDCVTGSITEVECNKCKDTSYVCHFQCYCHRTQVQNGLECSYKEQLRTNRNVQHIRKSIHICNVIDCTITLLRRNNGPNGNTVCPCGNPDWNQLVVTGVDRLGFITSIDCCVCGQKLGFSPLEASYIVQMLYHEQLYSYRGQSIQEAVIQKALNGDYVKCVNELCVFIRRHSFYENSICPASMLNDEQCCRVTAVKSGRVTELEFDVVAERLHEVQRLRITCGSDCYYRKSKSPCEDNSPPEYTPPSVYERTYKAKMRGHLETASSPNERRESTSDVRIKEVILSCSVLSANAIILRRHSVDNKLCQNCKNDDQDLLQVTEIDRYGFITGVQCSHCGQSMSTACRHSRFYYEEIDNSMTLERGDHVSWHRNLAYWHHAVVTDTDNDRVTIAHYEPRGCSVVFKQSTTTRQDMSASLLRGIPYRVTYDDCYTNEYSALRSEQYVGDKRYDPINRNCEHSSNWCRTGLSKSDQMTTCFSTVGKTTLAFGLRILNVLLLMAFQVIHEERENIQIDRKAFEQFEHMITGAYMLLVFLLFVVWSMYTECNKLKRTAANKCCCGRPPGVAFRLSIRILIREVLAALGPFLLIWFEDRILPQETLWLQILTISLTLLGVTLVSYVLGAGIGTLLEYTIKCCCFSQRQPINDHLQAEILPNDGSQQELVIQ